MSMTKHYLESLPQDQQDAILGGIDSAYISPGLCEGCYKTPCICLPDDAPCDPEEFVLHDLEWTNDAENEPTDEELAEWARALIEEDDRECAPLIRPEGKCVRLTDSNGVEWKL